MTQTESSLQISSSSPDGIPSRALQVQVASAINRNPVLVHKLRVMLSHLEGTVPGQGIVHMKGVPRPCRIAIVQSSRSRFIDSLGR